MAKNKKIEVTDMQKDGDIVIETIVEKVLVPVCDMAGMILYWIEE